MPCLQRLTRADDKVAKVLALQSLEGMIVGFKMGLECRVP